MSATDAAGASCGGGGGIGAVVGGVVHAEVALDSGLVVEQVGGGPGEDHAAAREHDDALGELADDVQVLLDEQDRHRLGRLGERDRDLVDDLRREALRGFVDEQQAVLVHERPGERDHLLLAAREGAGALGAARVDVGEQPLDELAARPLVALGEPQVLGDGERTEDLAVLGHVADAALHDAVGGQPVDAIAAQAHLARSGR